MKSENEDAYQLWKGDFVYKGYDAFIMMLEFKFPRIVECGNLFVYKFA